MRILLDANISHRVVAHLEDTFPGITHIRFQDLDQITPDHIIWNFARDNGYAVIMTKDVDFLGLLAQYGPPPKVIHLRVQNQPNRAYIEFLLRQESTIRSFLDDEDSSLLEFDSLF